MLRTTWSSAIRRPGFGYQPDRRIETALSFEHGDDLVRSWTFIPVANFNLLAIYRAHGEQEWHVDTAASGPTEKQQAVRKLYGALLDVLEDRVGILVLVGDGEFVGITGNLEFAAQGDAATALIMGIGWE